MVKINYVIATWSGKRRVPNNNYLKDHVLKLSTLKHKLSQITIVKPMFNGMSEDYYEIKNLSNELNCDVVVLEKHDNLGQSYGQLFYTYEKYKDKFDYYIFCEDDYLPHLDYFDTELLKRKSENSYLCSYCGLGFNGEKTGGCSVSNGMISTRDFEEIYKRKENPIESINSGDGNECHKNFAKLLHDCGIKFEDFASEFSVPYFGTSVIEYGKPDTTKMIFAPNQILNYNMNFRRMVIEDLPFFLGVRNQSTEYLHNDTKFSLEEATEWFTKSNPKFYIIQLGTKPIGYFRTSNWDDENKTMYLGCDIHPNYRGFGFAQQAYAEFIDILFIQHGLKNIRLEVLGNNDRAKHIYNKIGFKQIGYGEKVIKDGKEIESIIMQYG